MHLTHTTQSPALSLVDQARSLFHAAQSRLAAGVFSEFVSLVQQFRSITGGPHANSNSHAQWEEIRYKAAALLAAQPDLYAMFEQLMQATQTQQR